jgi:hypothetical protein
MDLQSFENSILRRIFGPIMAQVTYVWRIKLPSEDSYNMNYACMMKSRMFISAGYVVRFYSFIAFLTMLSVAQTIQLEC